MLFCCSCRKFLRWLSIRVDCLFRVIDVCCLLLLDYSLWFVGCWFVCIDCCLLLLVGVIVCCMLFVGFSALSFNGLVVCCVFVVCCFCLVLAVGRWWLLCYLLCVVCCAVFVVLGCRVMVAVCRPSWLGVVCCVLCVVCLLLFVADVCYMSVVSLCVACRVLGVCCS